MKTTNRHFKKPATTLFAMRFALVIGFLVFTVSIGKSQVDKTYVTNNPTKTSAAGIIQPVSQPPAQIIKTNVITEKMGEHAPGINDIDFDTKNEEWIKNYPDEYMAWLLRSPKSSANQNIGTYPEFNQTKTNISQKVAEHAPDLNDPDYYAKKLEWMINYPEEYNACLEQSLNLNNGLNNVLTTPVQNPSLIFDEQVPSVNNIDYNNQNDERMKNYPEEVTSKPFTGMYSGTNQVRQKPATKVAEHAPYLNDPDYEVKKIEWIKNYPQEYEQSLNSSIP